MSPQPAFDYDALDEATRIFVRYKAEETRGLLKRTARHVLAIGRNLQEVKDRLPHGQFLTWLQAEFGMSERHARNFMRVAARFGDKSEIIADLSVTILYELAAPSTPDTVVEQVENGIIPATLEAIRAAKEAERQAKEEEQQARVQAPLTLEHLFSFQEMSEGERATVVQVLHETGGLQEHSPASPTQSVQSHSKAVEQPLVAAQVTAQLEALREQIQHLTEQRDVLVLQVTQLGEEARASSLKRDEGEPERRIRLNWFRITNAFQASIRALLAEWPSPLDTRAFEAEDWHRLAQIKELARRFLAECDALTGGSGRMVVDGSTIPADETARSKRH